MIKRIIKAKIYDSNRYVIVIILIIVVICEFFILFPKEVINNLGLDKISNIWSFIQTVFGLLGLIIAISQLHNGLQQIQDGISKDKENIEKERKNIKIVELNTLKSISHNLKIEILKRKTTKKSSYGFDLFPRHTTSSLSDQIYGYDAGYELNDEFNKLETKGKRLAQ